MHTRPCTRFNRWAEGAEEEGGGANYANSTATSQNRPGFPPPFSFLCIKSIASIQSIISKINTFIMDDFLSGFFGGGREGTISNESITWAERKTTID